jgi:HPt (histidine-containing phosphotransfer) domain-containing protein
MSAPATASPGTRPTDDSAYLDAAWSRDVLRIVWERRRDLVQARIETLKRAVVALEEGRVDPKLMREAERVAHMLAGSVGMFGFVAASKAAHELEVELTHPAPGRAPALSALLESLRSDLQSPVTPAPD